MSDNGGDYSYDHLEPLYQQRAIKELRERPERVHASIASLRRWLNQSPHIVECPSDDTFLLRFLRVAKFDQEKAQKQLENFCTIRGSQERGLPSRFDFPSLDDEGSGIEDYLRMGTHIPLGYNDDGELVILIRFHVWDMDLLPYDRLLLFTYMMMDTIFADERTQVAGISAIIDLGDVTKKQNDAMMKQKYMKECIRIWQEGYAMRNRQVIYYREPPIFDIAFELLKFWMNPKLISRMHRVKHDVQKIHKKMPGVKAILPKEMGGENGTIEACRMRWEEKFREHWIKGNPLKNIEVDESKRPMDTLAFLRQYEDYNGDALFGTEGVYTPINAM